MKILNLRQNAKLNMYNVVIVKCDANQAAISANTALINALDEFKVIIGNINTAAQSSSAVLTGIAAAKQVSKADVSQLASVTAGQIFAYAAKNKNLTLKNAIDFSANDLKRMKDAELVPRCQTIHDLGVENLSALGNYGVTAAKLAELQTAIDNYAQSAPKPRVAITDRSTLKANIKQYFKDADAILDEQIDRLVEAFAENAPDFVANYKAARKIVEPKSKPRLPPTSTNSGGTNTPA